MTVKWPGLPKWPEPDTVDEFGDLSYSAELLDKINKEWDEYINSEWFVPRLVDYRPEHKKCGSFLCEYVRGHVGPHSWVHPGEG